MTTFQRALEFATIKHAGQTRRTGGAYIVHPIRVAQNVFGETLKVAALLHDVLEDTQTTYEELQENFGLIIADIVLTLTQEKDEPYMDYIKRVKTNPDAVKIKLADISDNLNDSPTDKAIKKTAEALVYLLT